MHSAQPSTRPVNAARALCLTTALRFVCDVSVPPRAGNFIYLVLITALLGLVASSTSCACALAAIMPHRRISTRMTTHGSAARVAWRCMPCRPCGCRVAAWRGVAWRGEALACAVIIGAASANVQTAIQLTPVLFVPQVHARAVTRARALLCGSVLVTGTVCLGWIAAIAATIGIVLVQLLFSGFFVRTQDIPEYMRWIQ